MARKSAALSEYVATLIPSEPVADGKWPDVLFALDGLSPERMGGSVRITVRERNNARAWSTALRLWNDRVRALGYGDAKVDRAPLPKQLPIE